jgi:hypothetical protein
VKRVHLARVHYHLYYRVRGEEVQVLALWHTSRGTGPQIEAASDDAEPRSGADALHAPLTAAFAFTKITGVGFSARRKYRHNQR